MTEDVCRDMISLPPNVSSMLLTGVVVAAVVTFVGNQVATGRQIRHQSALQTNRDQREDRAAWDRQIAQAIAVTLTFLYSMSMLRAGWVVTQARRTNDGRKSAVEIHAIAEPAMGRLAALITVALHRDGDEHIVERARDLGDQLDSLFAALQEEGPEFDSKMAQAKHALKEFRQAAEDRHRDPDPIPGRWSRTATALRHRFTQTPPATGA